MIKNNLNKILKGDRTIIIIVAVLMLLSALIVGSTFTKMVLNSSARNFSFIILIKQLFFSGIAFTLMVILSQTPYQIYSKTAVYILGLAAFLTLITVFFGVERSDAKRWLTIPFLGIEFQTSDFVKLALVIYISKIISEFNFNKENHDKIIKHLLIVTVPIIILTAKEGFSTAFLMSLTLFALLFVSPLDRKKFYRVFAVFAVIGLALFIFAMITKTSRGETWLNRFDNSYQKLQAKIAISNGGIVIKPGKSEQKHVLESSFSDFVFAIIAEEYGIFGVVLVISLYLFFLYRIGLIIRQQKWSFPLFLTLGITFNIIFQAFLHIIVNIGIIPVTGQPLPLVSHGGTAMIMTAAQIGIILNISQNNSRTSIKPVVAKTDENTEIQIEQEEIVEEEALEIKDYPFIVD